MKRGAVFILLILISSFANAEILFQENFEDTGWAGRGWYDGSSGTLDTTERVAGSTRSLACTYDQGARGCSTPRRVIFSDSEIIYLSYWTKYSANWEGSNRPYHPHEMMFFTNADGIYCAPANSHLSIYIEQVEQVPRLAIQDSLNVNNGCIVQNNQPVDACDHYNYGEQKSVASCNGIVGTLDQRDCYNAGSYWYSSRGWNTDDTYFSDSLGQYYKNDWHYIEAMWEMNTIQSGVGLADGKIRYWYDGELLMSSDNILLRTGEHPNQAFNQFFMGQYIGDGSPVTQTQWVDNLTISTHRISFSGQSDVCSDGICNGTENCTTCPVDCGDCCGDGTCNNGENCTTCSVDCGQCPIGDCDATVCQNAVFCSQFEEGNKDIWDDYDSNPDSENLLMEFPGPCGDDDNHVMRFRVPEGRGGADLVKELPTQHDKLYARWYQMWEPGYDFSARNHGSGLHAGARNNLGRSDYRPNGDDWFTTWLEPTTVDNEDGWMNLYSYSRGMYIDCANPQGSCWGDHFPCMFNDNYCEKEEHKGTSMQVESGVWYCMEIMLDGGTPVNNINDADGVQNFWIDGTEYGPFENLWHRTTSELKVNILWLDLFHHGEHSVEGIMYDNVVVSENRIGCLGNVPDPPEQCTDADTNLDGEVSVVELNIYINGWKTGLHSLLEIMGTIFAWKTGCT